MYILYVDESGDPGKHNQYSSKHFILSGLIVSFEDWQKNLDDFIQYRSLLKKKYGLLLRTELHASELIRVNKTLEYRRIRKKDRIAILKDLSVQIPNIFSDSIIINICLKKKEHPHLDEFQTLAWSRMIQRYENFLQRKNYSKGIIISDDTNEPLVRLRLRKMRRYNPIPSKYSGYNNIPVSHIIEDVFMRNSKHSYFLQVVDIIAHLLYRHEYPKGSLKKHQIEKAFECFESLLLKKASASDPLGIVRK